MRRVARILAVLLLGTLAAHAAGKRDPLTPIETDQLRETAQEPDNRLKLFVKFAEARMLAIDQMRSDPNMSEGRGRKLHDLIEDLTNILDETADNIDSYSSRKLDIRKSLKTVIEAMSAMQLKVRAVQQATTSSAENTAEAREYEFALQTLLDSVNTCADLARQTLDDQIAEVEAAKQEKKKKKN